MLKRKNENQNQLNVIQLIPNLPNFNSANYLKMKAKEHIFVS